MKGVHMLAGRFFYAIAGAIAAIVTITTGPAAAASQQSAATSALVSYQRSHYHNTDVEQPSCYILQSWAQCSFGTGHGMAEVNAWLHLKNGAWAFVGQGGGVTNAQQLEKWYGIPASIAKEFQAKQ